MLQISQTMGAIVLTVSPYPARVYQNAPPGTPVLNVTAYDDVTGAAMERMYLSPGVNSSCFKVDVSTGILSVNKTVQWTVGTVLTFFVYAGQRSELNFKHVMIIVSVKNRYAPTFTASKNDFRIYRYAAGKRVGSVMANDRDPEQYNHIFKYSIPDERADTYLKISSNGDITLKTPPPASIRELFFPVIAADEGSPRLTGTSMIQVSLIDVEHPSVFCFATEVSDITLCWKNPMVGRPEVTGFEVEVTGSTNQMYQVPAKVTDAEICDVITDTQIGKLYYFRVSIKTTSGSGGTNYMKVMINNTGIGFTHQCLHNDFDACKYLKPCRNSAVCRRHEDGALNYQCDCTKGWRGKNCTLQDMCAQDPCQNKGTCNFLNHQRYSCSCVDDFYGPRCQYFNACSILPCQNNGVCSMDTTGRYTCACPDHFTGKNCELKDPCNPSPCTNGGTCSRVTDDEFHCACTSGYYGHTCSELNLCISQQPCKNNGTCEHVGDSNFRCHCTERFMGKQCLEFDPCSQSPCQNTGTCVLTETGAYNCECIPGFYGGECQHFDTCHLMDCGSGTCTENADGAKCMCDPGHYGDHCEFYNPCDGENPCGLRGTCRNVSNSTYECDCIDEWYGLQCQYLNSCRLVNCENGGYCENFAFLKKGNFTCKCLNGFYGDTCSFYNPCVSSPCRHGDCTNTTSNEYICNCDDGYYGNDCEIENPCKEETCKNGGTCLNTTDTEFMCLCTSGFVGTNCELPDPCETPCANSGTCTVDPGSFGKVCHCPEKYTGANCDAAIPECSMTGCQHDGTCVASAGVCACTTEYTGSLCEMRVTPCTSNPCSDDRRCVEVGDSYTCVCKNGADNDDCIEDCPEQLTYDRTGRYTWPQTKRGQKILVLCDHQDDINKPNMATRECLALASNRARWSDVDSSKCPEYGLMQAGQTLNELKSLTSDPSQINADQLANFTNMLERVFSYSLFNTEIADSLTSVVSNLADVNVSVSLECDNNNKTSRRLVQLLETYSAETNNTEPIMSANVNIRAMDIVAGNNKTMPPFSPLLLDGNHTVESGLSITLPPEAMKTANSRERRPLRVQFIGYRKSMFFIPTDRYPEGIDGQRVVTAIVKGAVVKNLSTPIIYKMRNIEAGRNHSCVYWDPENRTWSYDGVTTLMHDDNTTECHTNHLTSFAILMDPNPAHPSPIIHEQILTYISYVGCAISLIGLILTIITYGLFRCMNKDKSGKILLNLCVSMLLMNVAFLMGAQSSSTYGEQLCMAVAMLLHYFLLTTLMWMLVEAVEMYQALVTVFAKYARFYMIKRCIVAWGVPMVIVVITMAVDLNNYRPPYDFCFISQASKVAYYVSLVGPGCLIVLINTIVFIMVARVILKPRFQQQQREEKEHVTPAQVRGAFTVMILLGVTWVFGPIAVNEARVVFNYLFCILNSLQGFFIFVFRCLYNPEARLAWIQLIKTGTLKTRRGPIKSVYSETSSKGDHSKSRTNVHFGGTLKSNIMQSNGWHHPKLNGMHSENGSVRNENQYFAENQNSEDQVFHTKDYVYLDNNTPPTRTSDMGEDGFTHL